MQVRITVTDSPAGTLVKVDGWLESEGAAELARVLQSAGPPVRLLAHDLRGVDSAGLSVLRRLAGAGAPIEGLSPYIGLLLASAAPAGPVSSPSPTRSGTLVSPPGNDNTEDPV